MRMLGAWLATFLLTATVNGAQIDLAWDDYGSQFVNTPDTHVYFNLYRSDNGGAFTSIKIIEDFDKTISTYADTTVGDLSTNDYCYFLTAGDTLTRTFSTVNKAGIFIVSADSEELVAGDYHAANAKDNDVVTLWHTQYYFAQPAHPHEVIFDLRASYPLDTIQYTPRQDGIVNGTIAGYTLYVSQTLGAWGSAVSSGTLASNTSPKKIVFTPTAGRYVRIVATSEIEGNPYTSAAEFDFLYDSSWIPAVGGNTSGVSNTACHYATPQPTYPMLIDPASVAQSAEDLSQPTMFGRASGDLSIGNVNEE